MIEEKIKYLFNCNYFSDGFDPEGDEKHYATAKQLLKNNKWEDIYWQTYKYMTENCLTDKDVYNFCNLYFGYLFDEYIVPNPYEFLGYIFYKINIDDNWDRYGDFIDSFAISILERANLINLVKDPYYQPWNDDNIIKAEKNWRSKDAEFNIKRFKTLLDYTHSHTNGKYLLYDNEGMYVEAIYDTDFESDNGLEEDEEGYEEYQSILFRRILDGSLFEVNYHKIPVKAICDGNLIYD